jgi:hypothetical protein
MKVDKHSVVEEFTSDYGDCLTVRYDNRGEPYREGIGFSFSDGETNIDILLLKDEALRLRDLIDKLYGEQP